MAINYGKAYRDFKKELEKKHALYDQLGMSKEQIDALDEFDWTEFRADCVYQVHTQPLEIASEPDFDEDKNPLYKKFGDVLSVELKVTFRDKYAWENFSLLRQRISNYWMLTCSEIRPRLNLQRKKGFRRRTSRKSSIALGGF